MKMSREEIEHRAAEAVRSALEGIPFTSVQGVERELDFGGLRPDLVTVVGTPEGPRYFVAEVRWVGQPRAAREAIDRLRRFRENRPDVVPVFIAPYISPASADLCIRDGAGYVDLSGNCRLLFDHSFIEREGRPNTFAEKRDLRSLYSPKASRVLRVLLANPGEPWRIKELAGESEVSLGLASNVKKLLEDREWVRKTERGMVLAEPIRLLAEWAQNTPFRKNEARSFRAREPVDILEAGLAKACRERRVAYALTGPSAAARLAPMKRPHGVTAYVGEPLEEVVAFLGLEEVDSGGNVTLLVPYDEGVLYGVEEEYGIRRVSPVQAYLDLQGFGGSGREAADRLLDEVIRPQWGGEGTGR